MPAARIGQECLALSGAAQAGGALGGTFGAPGGVPMTLPDFLMIGAPKAGTTALPVSPRTGARIAKVIGTRNSPTWMFDEATLQRATVAPGNPDYVDVVLHSCRHRLDSHRITRRTRRLSRGWPLCRRSRSRPSPWAAWQTATSPRLTTSHYSCRLIQGELRDVSGHQPAATARRACLVHRTVGRPGTVDVERLPRGGGLPRWAWSPRRRARAGLGGAARDDDVFRAGRLPAVAGDRFEGESAWE